MHVVHIMHIEFKKFSVRNRLPGVIRATFSRGYIPSKGKLVRTSCATVIYSDEPLIGALPVWNILKFQ